MELSVTEVGPFQAEDFSIPRSVGPGEYPQHYTPFQYCVMHRAGRMLVL